MSFIRRNATTGKVYAPGWFLANNEDCTRVTKTIKQDDPNVITTENGFKYVPMGATYKETTGEGDSAAETVIGVVYEDVDVTTGDMPGSVVTQGTIYADRLVTPGDADALAGMMFIVLDKAPAVERPEGFDYE